MLVHIDPRSRLPLHRQIADSLRAAILDGRLAPGDRVPSSRVLARDLAVARMTVLAAYERLAAEGYLSGAVGSGTRVSRDLPDAFLRAPLSRAPAGARAERPRRAPSPSARGRRLLAARAPAPAAAPPRAFALGVPALDLFPRALWGRLSSRLWRASPPSALAYGPAAGHPPLRRAIAKHLAESRGVRAEADQVIVVAGSQSAFDLCARVLLDPGDVVWVEEPGYHASVGGLSFSDARLAHVPVDSEGLDVAAARRRAPRPRLVLVTPSNQFPLGVTMSLARRLALLDTAARSDAFVLEDDYDAEFRFGSRPLSALQGLDRDGRVVYAGTFSKSLFPSLRLGYLVVPPRLATAFAAAHRFAAYHAPVFDQVVLAEFIAEGHFERHLRRMRAAYAERREALLAAIRSECGAVLEPLPSEAGLHVTFRLPPGARDRAIAFRAAAAGVDAVPLSLFHRRPPRRGGLVLGFAAAPPRDLRAAAKRLRAAIPSPSDARAVE